MDKNSCQYVYNRAKYFSKLNHLKKSAQIKELWGQYDAIDWSTNSKTMGIEIEGSVIKPELDNFIIYNDFIKSSLSHEFASKSMRGIVYKEKDASGKEYEYIYQVKEDASVEVEFNRRSLEFVSPILRKKSDVTTYFKILEGLNKEFDFKEEESAGIHFHYGFEKPQIAELFVLSKLFELVQDDLFYVFNVHSIRKGRHTKKIDIDFPILASDWNKFKKINNVFELLNKKDVPIGRNKRDYLINFMALLDHGTIEIRLLNSSMNRDEILSAMLLFSKIIYAVREKNPQLYELIEKGEAEGNINLVDLKKILNMNSNSKYDENLDSLFK